MRSTRRSWLRAVLVLGGWSALAGLAFAKPKKKLGAARGIHREPAPVRRRRPKRYDREPRVIVVTSAESQKSEQLLHNLRGEGVVASLESRGWEIGSTANKHLQLVTAEARPDIVARFAIDHYPWVGCLDRGGIVRSFSGGCSTPLDTWALLWLITGEDHRPEEPVPEEIAVEWTGHYRLRGGHWSIDGDDHPIRGLVLTHLRHSRHANRFPQSWNLEDWSYHELLSLHDDLHERGQARALLKAVPGAENAPVISAG